MQPSIDDIGLLPPSTLPPLDIDDGYLRWIERPVHNRANLLWRDALSFVFLFQLLAQESVALLDYADCPSRQNVQPLDFSLRGKQTLVEGDYSR